MTPERSRAPDRDAKPGPVAGPRSPWRTLCRWTGCLFLWTHRTTGVIVCTLICLLLYLRFVGFPGFLVGRACAWLAGQDVHVSARRVRIEFLAEIVVEGLRFYESAGMQAPLLEADHVALSFSPMEWLDRKPGVSRLQVRGAMLRIHTGGGSPAADAPQVLALRDVHGLLGFEPEGVRVDRMSADFAGMRLRGSGLIAAVEPSPEERLSLRDVSRTIRAALKNLPAWLPELVEQVNAATFDAPPKADFDFFFKPGEPLLTSGRLDIMGFGTNLRGAHFDRWTLRARLQDGRLEVSPLSIIQGDTRCYASGTLDVSNRVAECHAYSTLPPATWLALVPRAWLLHADREGLVFGGEGSFELWCGPADAAAVLDTMTGWASARQAEYRGVWIERAFAQFRKEGPLMTFSRVDGVLGRGAQQGELTGSATLRFDTREYTAKGMTDCDPNAVLPLLSSNQAEVISALVFGPAPHTEIEVSGVMTNLPAFTLTGHFSGRDFSFRGADIRRFESDVAVTNGVMTFTAMEVEREEGRVTGNVALDFDRGRVDYDVVSTASPYAVGRILGSNIHEFVSMFRFEGPIRVASRGCMDYENMEGSDLVAEVEGQRVGMDWLLADRAKGRIRMKGTRVDFEDVEGVAYGGAFAGSGAVWDVEHPTHVRYEASGSIRTADFRRVMASMREVDGEIYKGLLTATARVAGVIGEGMGGTVTGEGRVRIEDGSLFQIPLLGGLSQILSRIYPGLGFATQTDFTSSFTIADSRVRSRDIYLQGAVISATGDGYYYFDERLDVRVQVKLLRAGTIASVVRLVTFPVTKLLEVNLSGTLADPRWRPQNLPKELFMLFD